MGDDIAIKVTDVSKDFVLPHEKITSVKSAFVNLYRRRSHSKEVQHALQGVSFEIKKGEFFGIVGRNGSGKSTLLKILAGIYQPTKGQVQVSGKLVPFIELGVGFNPELTGRENVYLNGALLGFSEKEIDKMYDEIVEFAELERFMDQKLKNYSSGMQVRLAFSVAVKARADILLVDEVLAVGDADFQRKCFDYFRTLKRDKKTVVFVSHDMDAVRQFCDRAALIDNSKVRTLGTPDSIAELYGKMFINEAIVASGKGVTPGPMTKRWGSKAATIDKLHINKPVISDDDEVLEFGFRLRVHEAIERPIVGFRINSANGEAITGTNSSLINVDTVVHEVGDSANYRWRLPNIFSSGKYEVSLSVKEREKAVDVWNSALQFEVIKLSKTPYIVAPAFKLTVEKS